MNKVVLIGRLTKEPTARTTSNGNTVTTFTLAVDRRVAKGQDKQADFIPVVAWGRTAEIVSDYTAKGHRLAVCGRIQTRTYESDNEKKYITEVVADEVELLQPKNERKSDDFGGIDEEVPF